MKRLFILSLVMFLFVGCTAADWNNFARSFEQGYNAGAANPFQPAWAAAISGVAAGSNQRTQQYTPQQQYIIQQQNQANWQRQQMINEMQRQNELIRQQMLQRQQRQFDNYYRQMMTPHPPPTTTYPPLWGIGK